ncbi:MAG: LysM peptidoglycan-binding domain-containing protein [Chloroflexi bacterium]|nr:LysM peptidoglycan-binding domain-containing protein [Chloroflexota bacterium]
METAQQAWAESEKATSEATTAATSTTETTAAAALPTWSISEDLLAGVRATPSQVAETPVATTPPATPAPAAEVQQVAEVKAAAPKIHVVVPGDTLSGIAYQHYGHASLWPKIFEANTDKISNPNLIYPGQELVIPEV